MEARQRHAELNAPTPLRAALLVTELAVSVGSAVVALGSMVAVFVSVRFARKSANAATRSADIAEIVERGRHYGWRIEPRTNETPMRAYTLRNVGTVDARDVTLTGDYNDLRFHDGSTTADVAPGQARLFVVRQYGGDRGGDIQITWTPALPDAEPLTWTESPPIAPPVPRP